MKAKLTYRLNKEDESVAFAFNGASFDVPFEDMRNFLLTVNSANANAIREFVPVESKPVKTNNDGSTLYFNKRVYNGIQESWVSVGAGSK